MSDRKRMTTLATIGTIRQSSHTEKWDNNVRQEENDNTGHNKDHKFNQKHKENDNTGHSEVYKIQAETQRVA